MDEAVFFSLHPPKGGFFFTLPLQAHTFGIAINVRRNEITIDMKPSLVARVLGIVTALSGIAMSALQATTGLNTDLVFSLGLSVFLAGSVLDDESD